MKVRITYLLPTLLFAFIITFSFGQETIRDEKQVSLIGTYSSGKILLRWAPSETWLFETAQKSGYRLERALYENEEKPGKFVPLNSDGIIRPFSREDVEKLVDTTDKNQLIAASLLYGKVADSLRRTPLKNVTDPNEIALRNSAQQNRRFFGLLAADFSFEAARILGLAFSDSTAQAEKSYVYRLSPVKVPAGVKPDTVYLLVTAIAPPLPARLILGGEQLEKKIVVKWPKDELSTNYSGFFIERSTDKISFQAVNKFPYKPLNSLNENEIKAARTDSLALEDFVRFHSYGDSLGMNYKPFFYRLKAIDPFGIQHIISDTIALQGRDRTPPTPVNDLSVAAVNATNVKLKWTNPVASPGEIKGHNIEQGFRIEESIVYNQLNDQLLSASTAEFNDKDPINSGACYYRVNTIDTAGNVAYGLPVTYAIEDSIPPLNPEKFEAVVDTSGQLSVFYPRSKSTDANRYMLYYAFGDKDEFLPFNSFGTTDTFFIDKINVVTLTKQLYLKIITIDFAGNMSAPSPALKIKIPDILAPLTPTLQYKALENNICYAKFEKSFSEDVDHYLIQRSINERQWETFRTVQHSALKSKFLEIRDTLKERGVYHRIRVIAVDESKLESKPSELAEYRDVSFAKAKPCQNFKAQYEQENKRVKLSWTHELSPTMKFTIYRKVNEQKSFFLVKTNGIPDYIDIDVGNPGKYTYLLFAGSADYGDSKPVSVIINVE